MCETYKYPLTLCIINTEKHFNIWEKKKLQHLLIFSLGILKGKKVKTWKELVRARRFLCLGCYSEKLVEQWLCPPCYVLRCDGMVHSQWLLSGSPPNKENTAGPVMTLLVSLLVANDVCFATDIFSPWFWNVYVRVHGNILLLFRIL